MNARASVMLMAAVWLLCAASSSAQVLAPPPRSVGGLFGSGRPVAPDQTRQELTMTATFLGGYDDNVSAEGSASVNLDPLASQWSGVTGLASTDLRYWRGSATSWFEASAGGFMNGFRNLGVRPLRGGDADVNASTRLGKTTLSGTAQLRYQPMFHFGTTSAPASVDVAPADPTNGISELTSFSGGLVGAVTQDWNPRHSTNVSMTHDRRRYTNPTALDTRSLSASVGHNWNFSRTLSFLTSYRLSQQSTHELGIERPLDSHTANLGLQLRRRVSRTRTLVFAGGGGAMQVDTVGTSDGLPLSYMAPSAYASVRMDVGRTWAVSANLNRATSVLEGITRETFLTTTASVWAGGNVGRRVLLAFTGTLSEGQPHQGQSGSYESGNGTIQVQYLFGRSVALTGNYAYYQHFLRDIRAVPEGFPRRVERNSARVGLTIWLPLFGTFPAGASGVGTRN